MRRGRRFRVFDPLFGIGSVAFFAVFIGISGFIAWGHVGELRETLRLRESGVHAEAVALETRSETWTGSDNTTYTVYYTKVGFTRGSEKVVEEIKGKYRAGEKVEVVYERKVPGSVKAASDTDGGGVASAVFRLLFSLAFVVFGITFAVGWYRDPF